MDFFWNKRLRLAGLARLMGCVTLLGLASSGLSALTTPRVVSLDYYDRVRSRPVRALLYEPSASRTPAPLVILSPSLGRGRTDYAYLARCWCSQGMLVAVLEHSGSNQRAVTTCNPFKPWQRSWSGDRWREVPGNRSETLARVGDVSFLIDQLQHQGNLKFSAVGVAGHGCGTVTALMLAGVPLRAGHPEVPVCLRDQRVTAVLAMSPEPPDTVFRSQDLALAKTPVLLIVGDDGQKSSYSASERGRVYNSLPDSQRFLIQLRSGGHDEFAGGQSRMEGVARVGQHYWEQWLGQAARLSSVSARRDLGTNLLFWRSEGPQIAAPAQP